MDTEKRLQIAASVPQASQVMDDRVIVSTSDWHLGNGGPADDSNVEGVKWTIQHCLTYQPTDIVLNGDIFERWQFPLDAILKDKLPLLQELRATLLDAQRVPIIHLVDGNHDANLVENVTALRTIFSGINVLSHDGYFDLAGWRFLHGYNWDSWNKKGPWRKLAHGFTWIAGVLERAFPGINENYLNPAEWVSPAKNEKLSIHGEIDKSVAEYVEKENIRLCYGHTHSADISRDKRIVNDGCCTGKRATFAVLWPDGDAILCGRNGK